jgi:dephospho-CoA kinase
MSKPKFKIIALTGSKGAGKDTVSKFIKQYGKDNNLDIRSIAFADPIKAEINRLFELDPINNTQYDLFKRTDVKYQLSGYLSHTVSARHLVREIGMLMRRYDESQFIRYVFKSIEETPDAIWIVTDMRFMQEYELLSKVYNSKKIKIKRNFEEFDNHITEKGFSDHEVDYVIENFNTENELKDMSIKIFKNILKEWE